MGINNKVPYPAFQIEVFSEANQSGPICCWNTLYQEQDIFWKSQNNKKCSTTGIISSLACLVGPPADKQSIIHSTWPRQVQQKNNRQANTTIDKTKQYYIK